MNLGAPVIYGGEQLLVAVIVEFEVSSRQRAHADHEGGQHLEVQAWVFLPGQADQVSQREALVSRARSMKSRGSARSKMASTLFAPSSHTSNAGP